MNTTTTILDDAQNAQAPLHVQIAQMCDTFGLDFKVYGCADTKASLWTISANGWGIICKELWREEAYWMLKGFLLANPNVYVSRKTMRTLENATHIEILVDNDSYRDITIEEAADAVKRGYEIKQREDILWDPLSECWVPTGDYFVELRPAK